MRLAISAVIPTKNRPGDLVEAVQSVLEQLRVPDELIIIDQSDTNNSRLLVEELFNASTTSINLIYVHDQTVSGLVDAKQRGVLESSGDLVSFLEDDVVLEKDYYQELEQGFVTKPEMMGCSGVAVEVAAFTPFYRSMFDLFHRGIFYDARMSLGGRGDSTSRQFVQSKFLSGGISAYRKEVFSKVRFDLVNDFFMYEDVDFSTRAVKAFGEDKFFINTAVRLDHRASPVNRYRLEYRWERKMRELFCFYKKNSEAKCSNAHLLWLLMGMLIEAAVSSARMVHPGPLLGFLKGCVLGLRYKIKLV